MSDLAPFWIREMQARIEADWNKMHEDQHRARMREITTTLSPDALHELWGSMELEESETVEIMTFGKPGVVTVDTATGRTAEFARRQAESMRLEAEKARMEAYRQQRQLEREKGELERARAALFPPASFTKIGEPKKLYKAITITEWREVKAE